MMKKDGCRCFDVAEKRGAIMYKIFCSSPTDKKEVIHFCKTSFLWELDSINDVC